jgi:hypothetical protein
MFTSSQLSDGSAHAPAASDWETSFSSGWHLVKPGKDALLRLDLPSPTVAIGDLHLAVRLPQGSSNAFGWCRWLDVTYLKMYE